LSAACRPVAVTQGVRRQNVVDDSEDLHVVADCLTPSPRSDKQRETVLVAAVADAAVTTQTTHVAVQPDEDGDM